MASPPPPGAWTFLVPLVAVGLLLLRNARERRLRVERLWISPTVILGFAALLLVQQPPPSAGLVALFAAALGLGALGGWWRGRLTHIVVDPETHELTSRASPLGMLLILGIFAVRYALRSLGDVTAGLLHVSVLQITDILMLLAVGLVCTQRLEMALRANRLLEAARAEKGEG
jgi:hypothetical protein